MKCCRRSETAQHRVVSSQLSPYYPYNCRHLEQPDKIAPMAKRVDERRFIALPAIASGTDANGHYFREHVCTLDLSANGARISHFKRTLKLGQELTIELRKHKLCFRVIWCGDTATVTEGQIGLQSTESLKKLPDLSDVFNSSYVDTWTGKGTSKKLISSAEEKVG